MQNFLKRTWAQINLDAVDGNISEIKNLLSPGVKLCAVVKADCYGHGFEYTALEMCRAGADWFAVSNLAEALQLRRAGIDRPVLILGYTPPDKAGELAYNDISQSVFSAEYAQSLSDNARLAGVRVNAHIKIDTGMSRIGFLYHDNLEDAGSVETAAAVCGLPGINPEGIFTHFSSADCKDGELFTRLQYELFRSCIDALGQRGIHFEIRHCCNSAAILDFPEMQLDMVRAGIILYGLYPAAYMKKRIRLIPVMELKSVVSMVKEVPDDTPVSYGRTCFTEDRRLVATVPIGYADGYPRCLSNKMYMLVNGCKAYVLGNICMDQTVIDVTGIPGVKEGTTVTVFGSESGGFLGVDEIADRAGTVNYEIVCGVSRRVPRVYIKNGEIFETTDYML